MAASGLAWLWRSTTANRSSPRQARPHRPTHAGGLLRDLNASDVDLPDLRRRIHDPTFAAFGVAVTACDQGARGLRRGRPCSF
jgi:hypothetical protein